MSECPTIEVSGVEYSLGCLEREAPTGAMPCLADRVEIIPRDKWEPRDLSNFVPSVLDQGSHGACVGFGATQGAKVLRRIAGLPDKDLSPWDLYRMICGGRDAGANIHSALSVLAKRGVATLDLVPSFTLSSRDTPDTKASAARNTIDEWFDCPDRASIATAIQIGYPVAFGVTVTTSWTPDGDGWIRPGGAARGGHCILGVGLVYRSSRWGVKFVNSWRDTWGIKGFGIYPIDLISDSYADAWAGRTMAYARS